jgi:hypothetical protein
LNPGNASSREYVPLSDLVLRDQIERFRPKLNLSGRDGFARAPFLRRYVDHLSAAIVRQVR